ncbi:MAG: hypothetical protein M3R24_22745 [Chloroflexota bacterium]|nr:hypothetical protein [Chloroflexota bacterium]
MLQQMGYTLEPVYHHNTIQYYRIAGTSIGVSDDLLVQHPVTGDYTTAASRRIFVNYTFDEITLRRNYDLADVKLYMKLYRRFREKSTEHRP